MCTDLNILMIIIRIDIVSFLRLFVNYSVRLLIDADQSCWLRFLVVFHIFDKQFIFILL